jgi:hypothetical protein
LPEWYRPHKNLLSNRHRSQRWPPGKAAYRNPGILWATKNPQRNSR